MLDILVHRNVRLSEVTVSDILDSDHLPILFPILDHVSGRNISVSVETHRYWEWFRSLISELISRRKQTDTVDEAERAANNFAASIALAYRLSTIKSPFWN